MRFITEGHVLDFSQRDMNEVYYGGTGMRFITEGQE